MKLGFKALLSSHEWDKEITKYFQEEWTVKRKESESILMRWMNLEPIIQSKVSWKEKNKYCILTYIYMESRKMVLMNLFAGQQWRYRHREHTYGYRRGRRGGKTWESSTDTRTLPCVPWIASGKSLYNTLVPCDILEGWGGDGGGREVQEEGDIRMPVTDSFWRLAESSTTLQIFDPSIKNNFFKKRRICKIILSPRHH